MYSYAVGLVLLVATTMDSDVLNGFKFIVHRNVAAYRLRSLASICCHRTVLTATVADKEDVLPIDLVAISFTFSPRILVFDDKQVVTSLELRQRAEVAAVDKCGRDLYGIGLLVAIEGE